MPTENRSSTYQKPVLTIQLPDPHDERPGPWFDAKELRELAKLPAGTKLYTSPAPAEPLCSTCNGYGKYQDGDSGTDEDGRCPNIVDCDCDDSERMPQYRGSAPVERDERVEYDAWRHSESGYVRPFNRHEWSAWQARAALERKPSTFSNGQIVRKKSGSEWEGRIVGTYSTSLTPEGYCVESSTHGGSVQIYPAGALERKP